MLAPALSQAMDRAHRLGQRRSVSVYRLLTRGTLEERIMGLQRFKLDVAHAVVNADNASLSSMDTAQVLDLFALQPSGGAGAGAKPAQATGETLCCCPGCFKPCQVTCYVTRPGHGALRKTTLVLLPGQERCCSPEMSAKAISRPMALKEVQAE